MSSQTPSDGAPENPQGQNQSQVDTSAGSDQSPPFQPSAGFPQQPGYVVQQPPPSGKVALQFGALFGVSLSVLLLTLDRFLATANFTLDFWLCVPAFLLAGLFAAKHTGKVSTGALAGLWAGFISNIIYWVIPLFFVVFTMGNDAALISAGILLILTSPVQVAIGSGLGALGGLLGRRLSPMAGQPSSPYPPASWPTQAFQDFAYQSSFPSLPQNVYRLRPLWRVFYAGIYPLISLIAGLSLASKYLDTSGSGAFSLFFICLIVLAVGYNIYYGIRMSMARLVTSPVGVTASTTSLCHRRMLSGSL